MSFCVISLGAAFISTHAVHCTCAWLSSLCCHQDIKIIDDRLSPCLPRFSLLPVWSDFFISGCSTSLCFALSSSAFSVLGCSKNFPAALWQLWSAVILQECSWNMMLSNSSSAMLHCSETQAHHTCLLSACKDQNASTDRVELNWAPCWFVTTVRRLQHDQSYCNSVRWTCSLAAFEMFEDEICDLSQL